MELYRLLCTINIFGDVVGYFEVFLNLSASYETNVKSALRNVRMKLDWLQIKF